VISALGDLRVASVAILDVERLYQSLAHASYEANRVLALVRRCSAGACLLHRMGANSTVVADVCECRSMALGRILFLDLRRITHR
jgi:hypothetical protein